MKPFRITCSLCQKKLTINKPELIGKRVKCPQCKNPLVIKAPASSISPAAKPSVKKHPVEQSPVVQPAVEEAGLPQLNIPDEDILVTRARRRQRKKGSSRGKLFLLLSILLLIGGFSAGFLYLRDLEAPAPPPSQPLSNQQTSPPVSKQEVPEEVFAKGDPLSFDYVPTGTRLVWHWHPAKIKAADSKPSELWQCGGPFFSWLENGLEAATGMQANDIAQATCYLIPGPRGQLPQLVFKIQPVENFDLQAWSTNHEMEPESLDRFQVYIHGTQRVVWLDDQKGLSIPTTLVDEALSSGTNPLPTTPGLDSLMKASDRDAEFLLLFDLKSAQLGLTDWFTTEQQELIRPVLEWWGEDTEAVLWQIQIEEDQLFSQVNIQAAPFAATAKLKQHWETNIKKLGEDSWADLRARELHSAGAQTVLARFPAMLQLTSRFTKVSAARQQVQLETKLSERAAPNLLLASWLYWRERLIPEGAAVAAAPTSTPAEKKSLAERLQAKMYVDFRLTPPAGGGSANRR
ncbi:MAG: hypothetical protein R3C11_08790 [Planctomycetaceae bacterium]